MTGEGRPLAAAQLQAIYRQLWQSYGPQHWWPASSPYEMMVGAVLTQNTAWSNVEKALTAFEHRLSPQFIAQVPEGELAAIIRSSGYHNQKAARLKALTAWFAGYAYDIQLAARCPGEELRRQLLAIKGIGPETADSILLYALNKRFFVIDAYTRRIMARLGEPVPSGYDSFRSAIEARLPRDTRLYNEFHALLVVHAKRHCRKRPECQGCPLGSQCPQAALGFA